MTAVPIHTVSPGPNPSAQASSTPPPGPKEPGSPQADPGTPDKPEPEPDNFNDIRDDLDHSPGGLREPDPQDQQILANAVPKNPDGTPQRFPDPFGPWSELQNDGGNEVPGRSNNCADCARSFLETWYGNPQVSAPRTLDHDEDGNPDPFSPENDANENQMRWAGTPYTYSGPGDDPNTAAGIVWDLEQAGHGAAAIVHVDWADGSGGHAFNAVNHNGTVVWVDTQSGEVSHEPLHIADAENVWHIPLDADRNPILPPETETDGSDETTNESTEDSGTGTDDSHTGTDDSPSSENGQSVPENDPSGSQGQPKAGDATGDSSTPDSRPGLATPPPGDTGSNRSEQSSPPNPTSTGLSSTPSPTASTTPTPSPDGRTLGPDARTPDPNQPAPSTTPASSTTPETSSGRTPTPQANTPNTSTPNSPNSPNSGTPSPNTSPSPSPSPGATPTTSNSSRPETTTPSRDPRQPAPPRDTPTPAQTPTATPSPATPDATAPGQTPESAPSPNSSTPNTPHQSEATSTPASATRDNTPPGGVTDPTRAEQDALENSVPRDENGDPIRPPDPANGPWVQNINGSGPDTLGRNNNCVDTALSTVDTYSGNPTAAGARTPDLDANGNPSDRGEKGGRDRIENALGARFSDMGNGRDAFNRLENTLRQSGHGSQAVIITQDANGRAHAWNAVNHNGKITYIDAQTGQQSSKPLHSGNNGVFAIPLDSNRQPVTPHQRADDGTQPQWAASETPTGADRRAPDEPAGTDPDKTNESPDDEGEKPNTGTAPERLGSTPFDEDQKSDHLHYGVAGDPAQQDFREHRSIQQIDLDPVYDTLRDFANNDNAGLRDLLDGSRNGTTWSRDDLANRIPGFNDLNRGQQAAAVGVLARLSNDFHMNQGVGASPYRREGDQSAYHWSESQDATEAREPHRKRDINRQTNFPGNDAEKYRDSRAAVAAANGKLFSEVVGSDAPSASNTQRTRDHLNRTYTEDVADQIVDATKDMKPNFLGRNFAVMEVYDPDTNQTHYVADSSFSYVGPRPDHSEPHLGGWIERLNEDRAANGQNPLVPAHLYTEREPCGHPSKSKGHADCGGYIRAYLPKEMGTTYATAYRKGEQVEPFSDPREGVNNVTQALEADFQDHLNKVADILKAYALPTPTSPA
ncbi:toxin glutamine deamidase domain-containing protein [Streptomyces albidochromogenes]|uniref:Toxin glutamine deamidase domain-containing protein n=1 Tax=Streptomyces albidochromogenes TaxID=329524 RepID=A0ABW6FDQ2_9ACTN